MVPLTQKTVTFMILFRISEMKALPKNTNMSKTTQITKELTEPVVFRDNLG